MSPKRPALAAGALAVLLVGLASSTAGASPGRRTTLGPVPRAAAGRGLDGLVYSFGTPGTGFGPKIPELQHALPTPVHHIPGSVVQIATSNSDTYALTSAGTVWAWGAGSAGELGNGSTTPYTGTPVEVHLPPGVRITTLANPMPYDSALAVDAQGQAYGWGLDWRHTVCLPGPDVLVPQLLPLSDVTLATGAGAHSLFDAGGQVVACGRNSAGELGNTTTVDSATPTPVVGLPALGVRALVSSFEGSGALMANGAYYDWGLNQGGQLGDGTTTDSPVPVKVRLPSPVVQVAQGGSRPNNGQTLAVLADGSVWAWGDGSYGQLGDNATAPSAVPVRVAFPAGARIRQVCSGGDSSYALGAAGRLWAWGGNQHGQLGIGDLQPVPRPVPVHLELAQISATATNVAGLAFVEVRRGLGPGSSSARRHRAR